MTPEDVPFADQSCRKVGQRRGMVIPCRLAQFGDLTTSQQGGRDRVHVYLMSDALSGRDRRRLFDTPTIRRCATCRAPLRRMPPFSGTHGEI